MAWHEGSPELLEREEKGYWVFQPSMRNARVRKRDEESLQCARGAHLEDFKTCLLICADSIR